MADTVASQNDEEAVFLVLAEVHGEENYASLEF